MRLVVLPSTVQIIRLKHGIFQVRSQSHPRQVAGALTLSQVAKALDIMPHWIYDRIHKGCIQISNDFRQTCTCFLMTLLPLSSSGNCGQGLSRPCVFQRSIKMHDRSRTLYLLPISILLGQFGRGL